MGADNIIQLCTCVDAAYIVQPCMKRHVRVGMSFGCGLSYCKSSKQKMNTKISTGSKVVGIINYLPHKIWVCLFIES